MRFSLLFLLFLLYGIKLSAQDLIINPEAQSRALATLAEAENKTNLDLWPNINPDFFYRNIKENIENPIRVYQGKPTYFCGYSALTHFYIINQPEDYAKKMLELYQTGRTKTLNRELLASENMQNVAGALSNKGRMDINPADQMWYLVLADNYKGYLNWNNKNFDAGDENNFWAAANLKKFNRMLRSLTGAEVHSKGSDIFGPLFLNYYKYISRKSEDNVVILYLNNKILYPLKLFKFIPPAPTHFAVLYDISEDGKYVNLKYWDYGMKTQVKMKKRKFRKIVYGIITIPKK